MGFRPIEKFASLQGVAPSAKATADLPAAGTYYAIFLHCLDGGVGVSVANIAADILNVRITLDGVVVYEASGQAIQTFYDSLFSRDGAAPRAGILPIILAPDYLTHARDSEMIAYGMGGVGVLQMEVDLGASIGTANHIDQIDVYVQRIPMTQPLGIHRRLLRFSRNFASAGVQEITDLPFEGGADVATAAWAIQYNGAAAVINSVQVLANNQLVMDLVPNVAQAMMEKAGRKWEVSGSAADMFIVPFDLSNDLAGFLGHKDLNDFRMRVNWSAAPNAYSLYRMSYHGISTGNK